METITDKDSLHKIRVMLWNEINDLNKEIIRLQRIVSEREYLIYKIRHHGIYIQQPLQSNIR